MKKNVLVPIEYTEDVITTDEQGNETTETVTKVRYEVRNVEMTEEEVNELHDNRTYEERVEDYIRTRYSISDELALLRQRDTKSEEFAEYNAFCEDCKSRAKAEV